MSIRSNTNIFATVCAAIVLTGMAPESMAGPGHDHGDEAPVRPGATALPRFTAASELFEMVGVLNGRKLTLYLDRHADNAPVDGAQVELEVGNTKLAAERHAEGEYEATLPQALKAGVTPVTVTVSIGTETDLLAGSFDLHDEASTPNAGGEVWSIAARWAAGAAVVLVLAGGLARRYARRGATA